MNKKSFISVKPIKSSMEYIKKYFILPIAIILISTPAFATTYYLSPSGNDSYSSSQAQNQSTPWKTFVKAFGAMSGGDTLALLDGTYSTATGTGYLASGGIPSGTGRSNFTTIKAVNDGLVKISSGAGGGGGAALIIGSSYSYIKFQGITFEGSASANGGTYIYYKNCGFYSSSSGEGVFDIASWFLVEDCWIWGNARIIAANYTANNNVWRRVVIRGDGCSTSNCQGSGNPNVGLTVYASQNVSFQNVFIIDRILGSGSIYANFASAQHSQATLGPVEWLGVISLKSPDEGFYLESDEATSGLFKISNSIVWDSAYDGMNLTFSNSGSTNALVENNTIGQIRNDTGIYLTHSSGTVRNIVVCNTTAAGIQSGIQPSYTNVYGANPAYATTTPTVGVKSTNPLADGSPASLRYLPRIETGSALKGTGYGGADYGANILYKYGTDGTFYGETGYNTLTNDPLWPYPNEAKIKSDMAATTGGARGFATGTSRDGSSQTLTKYIWEYIGNTIPADIYSNSGGGSTVEVPGAPQTLSIVQ
jgi:hypothetical protein